MMRSRVVLVDLPEDGRRVVNCTRFPAEQTARPTTYRSGKGEFRSWKNTNCQAGIFRCGKTASAGIEVAGGQFVAHFGRTGLYTVQAVIAHAEDLLCCLQPQPTKKRWKAPRALMLATAWQECHESKEKYRNRERPTQRCPGYSRVQPHIAPHPYSKNRRSSWGVRFAVVTGFQTASRFTTIERMGNKEG